jgi:hypothetical protein
VSLHLWKLFLAGKPDTPIFTGIHAPASRNRHRPDRPNRRPGAGREKKGDAIDHGVRIEVLHKVGERVEKGQPLLRIHARDRASLEQARERLLMAYHWSEEAVEAVPLFYGVVKPEQT